MPISLAAEVIAAFNDPASTKILATTDEKGIPHVVFSDWVSVNETGNIQVYELLEASPTNENLVRSIWFKKPIAITAKRPDHTIYQVKGLAIKCMICGPEFEAHYKRVRDAIHGDLASVWIIQPDEVQNESYALRAAAHESAHPLLIHLDRLAL